MIAFGCSFTSREKYERFAAPGIARASAEGSAVLAEPASGPVAASYNSMLDAAAANPELEGLALLHQDLSIDDQDFVAKVRRRLEEPEIAVIGIAGGRGVRNMAWWDCDLILGCWRWQYYEHGGGTLDPRSWDNYVEGTERGCHEVDSVDGMLLVLSPWAVRNLRFDEGLGSPIHGYDVDICFQARAAGKRVVVDELHGTHHHEATVVTDYDGWKEAYVLFMRKWEGRLPGVGETRYGSWEERARRAEAETQATRIARNELSMRRNESDRRLHEQLERAEELQGRVRELQGRVRELQGRVRELEGCVQATQRQIEVVLSTRTWRYTEPLRRAAAWVREIGPGRRGGAP